MQRLREMLAYGGIAMLAVVVALGLAALDLARAIAQELVRVLSQQVDDPELGLGPFGFRIAGTEIDYSFVLQAAFVLLMIGAIWLAAWRLTRSLVRECPECLSEIPHEASVCRYCTAELGEVPSSR